MANPLIRAYDNLNAAQNARAALLNNGFAADSIELRALQSEAGPVKNNAVLDEKDTGHGPKDEFGIEERTDAHDNTSPEWGANFLLTVGCRDDEQLARAGSIMDDCGAIDPQRRSARAQPRQ
jgi:hypothetical protein